MPAELHPPSDEWFDGEAGPVVRPYAMTQGRVPAVAGEFDLVAFVVATVADVALEPHLQPEHHAIIAASWEPVSVAEIASRLDLAVGVIRVLLSDLRSAGLISLYEPPAASQPHDVNVLKAVVNGLRAL
jgi:hypothetical protein